MQGGRRSHSGAMATDDNEAGGAIPDETGETSPRPWVLLLHKQVADEGYKEGFVYDFQDDEDEEAQGAAYDGAVDTDPGQVFTDFAFQEGIEFLLVKAGQHFPHGDADEGVFVFQDDFTSPADLVVNPVLDFRVLAAVVEVMHEFPFQEILQFVLAFYAGGEIGLAGALRRGEPHFYRQGIDELILPALYRVGQLAIHSIHLQFQFLTQPLPFFAAGVFPPFQPDDDALLHVFGYFFGVDHARKFIQGHDEVRSRPGFGHPFVEGPDEDGFKFLAAHAVLDEADDIGEHLAVRVFQHGDHAVLQKAQQGLPLEVGPDMGRDILLILALPAIFIGLLGDFKQQGPEFFPAAAAGQPVRKFVYKGDGI